MAAAPEDLRGGICAVIRGGELENYQSCIQVSTLDCTGCELCLRICPADAQKLESSATKAESAKWEFGLAMPDRGDEISKTTTKGSQFQKSCHVFSGACQGCGQTHHVRLLTPLVGERLLISSATGCSSIWGVTNPSFLYTVNS